MSGEAAKHEAHSAPTPGQQLLQAASAYQISACLYAAAHLNIADHLGDGSKHVSELAWDTHANEGALYRVLRALASIGIFKEVAPGSFANTPVSALLRSGTHDSQRDAVAFLGDPFHYRCYAETMHSVMTGETVVKRVTGHDVWEHFEKDRAEGDLFHAAMASFSAMFTPPVLPAYDFSGLGTLADIAGGTGFLLSSILKKHVHLRGILFDVPAVAPAGRARMESLGLASRCEVVSGDFFKEVPAADNYLMKNIIHDWDDAHAIAILKNCAAAMHGKGKILLVELVIPPGNEPHYGKLLDIEMLLLAGGRERTEAEYADLFSRAGLRLARVAPSNSPACVIEAVKA